VIHLQKALLAMGVGQSRIDLYLVGLNDTVQMFTINTPLRVAAFLAQVVHESGLDPNPIENLNYSGDRLMVVFPRLFPTEEFAGNFAYQPEKIANRIYGGRDGNGPPASGDGWMFRGRGLIQVTGRENYRACGKVINLDLENNPDLLAEPIPAALSAGWFWNAAGLNTAADLEHIEFITRKINGGLDGLAHRMDLYEKARAALA